MKKRARETFECPNCGAVVEVGRKACRECGSDDLTGWQPSEEIDYQSLDIPDYLPDDVERHGDWREPKRPGLWAVVAIVVVIAFVMWAVLGY